jgi:cell division transport system ATP-binding protein
MGVRGYMASIVSMTGVSKSYFGESRVLDQVTVELKKGDFIYVVGGTGAGKSSLLNLLATEELATAGKVSLFGYDVARASSSTLRAIRRSVGYIPQGVRLIPDLSVFDNIALSVTLAGRRIAPAQGRARIGELMERLGLTDKRDKPASALSGGEAQRVAVARALARNPELIVADEPTGAQDRDFTWSLMDLFLKSNLNGATVIVATHDREIVRRVRKRCAVLKDGRVQMEDGGAQCFY